MVDGAPGIVVVRVWMGDYPGEGRSAFQLWAAATRPEDAVAAVLAKLPSGWTGELTDRKIGQDHARRLNLKLGGVAELTDLKP